MPTPELSGRYEFLQADPAVQLYEDQVTELLALALTPLRDPVLAAALQAALVPSVPLQILHPVVLTGSGRPDLVLVDDNCVVHVVVEHKTGGQGNRRKNGKLQIDEYVANSPSDWDDRLDARAPSYYVLLTALSHKEVTDYFPDATSAGTWKAVDYERLLTATAALDVVGQAHRFLRYLQDELRFTRAAAAPASTADAAYALQDPFEDPLVAVQALEEAAGPFPDGASVHVARRLAAHLSKLDATGARSSHLSACHEAISTVAEGSGAWTYELAGSDQWVRHILRHRSSGVSCRFGVPPLTAVSSGRMHVGTGDLPPGHLGRLYVTTRTDGGNQALPDLAEFSERRGGLVRAVTMPPLERALDKGARAVGFCAFHPLWGEGYDGGASTGAHYVAALQGVADEVVQLQT